MSIQSERWKHCSHPMLKYWVSNQKGGNTVDIPCLSSASHLHHWPGVPVSTPGFGFVFFGGGLFWVFFFLLCIEQPCDTSSGSTVETHLGYRRRVRVVDRREQGWSWQRTSGKTWVRVRRRKLDGFPGPQIHSVALLFLVTRHTHAPYTARQQQYSGDRPYLYSRSVTLGRAFSLLDQKTQETKQGYKMEPQKADPADSIITR